MATEPRRRDGAVAVPVHYAPGEVAICGATGAVVRTVHPALVRGCLQCEEQAAEDVADMKEYRARCPHCHCEITAWGGVAWRRTVRQPCPNCGARKW